MIDGVEGDDLGAADPEELAGGQAALELGERGLAGWEMHAAGGVDELDAGAAERDRCAPSYAFGSAGGSLMTNDAA